MSKVYPKFKHFDAVWLKKGYHGKKPSKFWNTERNAPTSVFLKQGSFGALAYDQRVGLRFHYGNIEVRIIRRAQEWRIRT